MQGIVLPPLFPLKRGYRRQLKSARKQLLRGDCKYICVCTSWGKTIDGTPLGKDIITAMGCSTFLVWISLHHSEICDVLTLEEMEYLCWFSRLAWIEALLNQKRE